MLFLKKNLRPDFFLRKTTYYLVSIDMEPTRKAVLATACLQAHEDDYGIAISPLIVQSFLKNLERADRYLWNSNTAIAGEQGTVRHLRLTPPSWTIQSELGHFKCETVCPDGRWKEAARYLPLFEDTSGSVIVVRIDDPAYPLGWLNPVVLEAFLDGHDSYYDGVIPLNIGIKDFLVNLHPVSTDRESASRPSAIPSFRTDLWSAMERSFAAMAS
ncbi:hypothetical protein Lepil_0132 [Leptonema illini DSM 21528]|uniref:Uncharacterized protein n=2 Tax=Leptonema illini TaxID=183 RepID=H2CI68_9LEPT|nr:hypothetical protein Lepil_0132 [Leptonema illini DSM 21528]